MIHHVWTSCITHATDALTVGIEREHEDTILKVHVRNKDLIVDKMDFEDAGVSGWVDSESIYNKI